MWFNLAILNVLYPVVSFLYESPWLCGERTLHNASTVQRNSRNFLRDFSAHARDSPPSELITFLLCSKCYASVIPHFHFTEDTVVEALSWLYYLIMETSDKFRFSVDSGRRESKGRETLARNVQHSLEGSDFKGEGRRWGNFLCNFI